ncbi:phospholipase D family protein [Amorphus sp. 3PC139-8]|uniref:phospholipase D family protein n=1 Tax=Amorphus sp. 3PC139-8 TaxID=2735676 RepID=UPI00345CA3D0
MLKTRLEEVSSDPVSAKGGSGPKWPAFSPYFPPRRAGEVVSLVEASSAFPVMETLILGAHNTASLAFRILDPDTKTHSEAASERGLSSWGEVFVDAAMRGVHLRILLADFEPVMAHDLHRLAWRNARRIMAYADRLPPDAPGEIDLLVALHEGELGFGVRTGLWPAFRQKLKRLVGTRPDAVDWPGVAHFMLGERPRFVPPARLWPASHHQKLLVVDGERTVIGGIDVDERRYDDARHDRPSDQTWHDVSLFADGLVAADAERHFADVWNREVTRYGGDAQVSGWQRPPGYDHQQIPRMMVPPVAPADIGDGEPDRGTPSIRLRRTLSAVRSGAFAVTPIPVVTEIEAAVLDVIGEARLLLYIENQFFRLRRVADAIGAQMQREKELEVVLLLPMAPDTVAFERQHGPEMRFGEWLQVRALRRLIALGSRRVGVFSLVRAARAEPGLDHRARAFGSGIIYPHAKVMIADRRRALVGSANLNGRSLKMDTEAALDWRDDPRISALQDRLFAEHLGAAVRAPDASEVSALELWRRTAFANLECAPGERNGFAVPYKLGAARRFARFQRFIPESYL